MRFLLVLLLAACSSKPHAPAAPPPSAALFDRLGGMDGLKGLMTDFVDEQLPRDARISARFVNIDKPRFADALAVQLCELTGGPCKYSGKSMKDAHLDMAITDADFAVFVEALEKSLVKFKVAAPEQRELLGIIGTLREQIIE